MNRKGCSMQKAMPHGPDADLRKRGNQSPLFELDICASPLYPTCKSKNWQHKSYTRATMNSQIDVSTIVDAVYQTVFDLTADIHQARWDAYWTLTSLIYPGIDEAPEQD